jgi:hypothetical protein
MVPDDTSELADWYGRFRGVPEITTLRAQLEAAESSARAWREKALEMQEAMDDVSRSIVDAVARLAKTSAK